MNEGGGAAFYSTLAALAFPDIHKYSPYTFDWLFEDEKSREVLDFISSNLSPENLVSQVELEAFNCIAPGDVLSGALLEGALEAAGDEDAQLSTEELSNQIYKLEAELGLQEDRLDTISQVKQQLVRKTNQDAIALDTLRKELEQWTGEERRKQEHVLQANSLFNSKLTSLSASLERVISLYRRPSRSEDELHLYQLELARVWKVEAGLDKELSLFISALFGSKFKELGLGDKLQEEDTTDDGFGGLIDPGSDACLELIRGREKQEFLHLRSEISRVRLSIFKTEMQRIDMQAKDAGLKASIAHVTRSVSGQGNRLSQLRGPVKPNLESDAALQDQLANLVAECVGCYCDMVLTTDYKLKHKRSVFVTNKMKIIRDILMLRLVRQEVLDLLMDAEMEQIISIVETIKNLEENLDTRFRRREGFRSAARCLGTGTGSDGSGHLIPPSDTLFSNTHSILRISGLVEPLATYSGVETALRTLIQDRAALADKLAFKQAAKLRNLEYSEAAIGQLATHLHIDLGAPLKSLDLVPSEVARGVAAVERGLRELEQKLFNLSKEWQGRQAGLKTKPYYRLQRDLWIDFILKPQLVPANVKAVVNKAKISNSTLSLNQ